MPKGTAKMSVEDRLQYILTVISYAEISKPDYQAIMAATGQSSANNAQKKFKAYVEQAGFGLVDRQIVRLDDDEDNQQEKTINETTKKKSPKPKQPSKSTVTAKPASSKLTAKRAREEATADPDEDGGPQLNKRPRVSDIIELSDDDEDNGTIGGDEVTVKVENPAGDNQHPDDAEREDQTEDDETDAEAEEDRVRRSRARSRTAKPDIVV